MTTLYGIQNPPCKKELLKAQSTIDAYTEGAVSLQLVCDASEITGESLNQIAIVISRSYYGIQYGGYPSGSLLRLMQLGLITSATLQNLESLPDDKSRYPATSWLLVLTDLTRFKGLWDETYGKDSITKCLNQPEPKISFMKKLINGIFGK